MARKNSSATHTCADDAPRPHQAASKTQRSVAWTAAAARRLHATRTTALAKHRHPTIQAGTAPRLNTSCSTPAHATKAYAVAGMAGRAGFSGPLDTDLLPQALELLLAYARYAHEVLGRRKGTSALAFLHDGPCRDLADPGERLQLLCRGGVDVDGTS